MTLGQRFARFVTDAVVRFPWAWRLLRGPLRWMFDRIAPEWDQRRSPGHLAAFEAALEAVPLAPGRVLDLGTGTGAGAVAIARRWPEADVIGVDLSERMVELARAQLPPEVEGRVRFETADAAALPHDDGSFDLVALANMIPFFDELARVLRLGGHVVFGFSRGLETPIYVQPDRLREELGRRGFTDFAELSAGPGTALVARRTELR